MTTVKTLLGQCIILLGIFVCNVQPWVDRGSEVKCELFPYHPSCRGSMSKRISPHGAEDNDLETKATPFEKRLWLSILTILDNDDDHYIPEHARGPKKGWNGMSNSYPHQIKDHFVADMDKMETDY